MKPLSLALLASVAATPLIAQETREMGAHVHGVSTLEMAVEEGVVEIDLLSPGMDIVGFEYSASTDADKDAVETAIRTLSMPENVLALSDAAECRLSEVMVHLHSGDHHHDEGEEHHHEGDHHEDEHAHKEAGDHDHDAGKEHDHGEGEAHAHGEGDAHEHKEHAEGEHDHDHDHEDGAEHSEFHAHYAFACTHPEALTEVAFPFFDKFANAREIEAQYVTEAGAGSAEIDRDTAKLTLN